ncbi:GLPGLI family protein [Chitinophaga sp.]|uniref:GLPGLI family protein n=1 Tax=Chitinophaga sp. TaxID=1869181 RepID=UPI002F956B2B
MKKVILTFSMGFLLPAVHAQQQQGRVLYERTVQMEMHMMGIAGDGNANAATMLPQSHKDQLEVLFGNDQSLRRTKEDDRPEEFSPREDGVSFRMMIADADDVTYHNFATAQVIEQREFGTKNYIITDSIHKLNWKLTGKTSTILNYPCQEAIAQRIGKRSSASMENGQLKQTEVADTSNIVAWFTPAIPVPAGPEYQGQLPGLILGIGINDGRIIYTAKEVSANVDVASIKAPSKGKKVTTAEFNKERDKMMADMQRSNERGRMMHTIQ